MSALNALEEEIIRVLSGHVDVQGKFGDPVRLVDGEAARAAFPFMRLARHDLRREDPAGAGPVEHRLSLEIYSRSGGREEANRLIAMIADVLRTEELTPTGHYLVLFHPVFSDVFLRADGTTFRGLLRLKAITDPE